MIVSIETQEIIDFVKIFTGKDISLDISDTIIIKLNAVVPIKINISLLANKDLSFTFNSITAAGINITGLARNQVFNAISKYNCDFFNFSLVNRTVILKVKGLCFKSIVLSNNINFDIEL
jgi:hypothetical protein